MIRPSVLVAVALGISVVAADGPGTVCVEESSGAVDCAAFTK